MSSSQQILCGNVSGIYFVAAGAIATSGPPPSITPTPPTHIANDILIVNAVISAITNMSTVTAGWTEITEIDSAPGGLNIAWYWKRATGSGTAGPEITASAGSGGAICYVFRGCKTSGTPYEDATTTGDGTTTDATPPTALITTTVANTLAVALYGKNSGAVFSSGFPPSGWTGDVALTEVSPAAFAVISKTQFTVDNVAAVDMGTLDIAGRFGMLTLAFLPA